MGTQNQSINTAEFGILVACYHQHGLRYVDKPEPSNQAAMRKRAKVE